MLTHQQYHGRTAPPLADIMCENAIGNSTAFMPKLGIMWRHRGSEQQWLDTEKGQSTSGGSTSRIQRVSTFWLREGYPGKLPAPLAG